MRKRACDRCKKVRWAKNLHGKLTARCKPCRAKTLSFKIANGLPVAPWEGRG